MVRAAMIGLGRWGRHLVAALAPDQAAPTGGIAFTAAVVPRPDREAEAFAARRSIVVHRRMDDLLAAADLDAVVIATPPGTHRALVEAAAAAGKHVLVEKPLALTRSDAEAAAAACAAAGVVFAVDQQFRFLPAYRQLCGIVAGGTIGEVIHLEGHLSSGHGHYYDHRHWRADPRENPSGPLVQFGEHLVDLMIDVAGPVSALAGVAHRIAAPTDLPDVANVLLRFEGGQSGHVGSVSTTWPHFRLCVYGTKGWVQLLQRTTVQTSTSEGTSLVELPTGTPERDALEQFGAAVRGTASYPVTADGAVHTVAVLEAAARSMTDGGSWVNVSA